MIPAEDNLVTRLESAGRISAEEARRMAEEMCAEGIRSAAEAEALIDFNLRIAGQDVDWDGQFQRTLRDYILLRTVPEGGLSDENMLWLRDTLTPEGNVRNVSELDLLILLLRQAEAMPRKFGLFVLEAICKRILREGTASAQNVARIRKVLTTDRRAGEAWISREEARCLWKTNTELGKAANDPSWNEMFARSIGNYLFARACPQPEMAGNALSPETWLQAAGSAPGHLTAELDAGFARAHWFEKLSPSAEMAQAAQRAAAEIAASHDDHPSGMKTWLRRRLGWDNAANQAERALVDFLNAEAPGLTAGLTIAAG